LSVAVVTNAVTINYIFAGPTIALRGISPPGTRKTTTERKESGVSSQQ
jgi:hypothetical protein